MPDDHPAPVPDLDPAPAPDPEPARGPDPVALVAGLAALLVAVLGVTDTLTAVDLRWVLAGAAIVVGVTVIVASTRRRARQDR